MRVKLVGIYKITSPSGAIYIGQSWDIKKRWNDYKYPNGYKGQPLIKRSLQKYGYSNHKFEIVYVFPYDIMQDVLDQFEIFFISQYSESGVRMLNLKSGGSKGKHAQSSKDKVSKHNKGRKRPESAIITTALKNRGRKITEEQRIIVRNCAYGNKRGLGNRGKVRTIENRLKISETLKRKKDNKGTASHFSKLTDEQVTHIRRIHQPRINGTCKLAKQFNVCRNTIANIINRKTWSHL